MFQTRTAARWRRREQPSPAAPWLPYEQRVLAPSAHAPLECRLYLVMVLDPRTNYQTVTLGYVGETSRWDPEIRLREHTGELDPPGQPWGDTIVEFVLLPGVYGCKADVWAAEDAEVQRRRPLYNGEYNTGNPQRIWPEQARAQRAARDAARLEQGEITPEQTWQHRWEAKQAARAATPRRRWLTARQRRQLRQAGLWLLLWTAPTLFFWWLAARYTPVVSTPRLGALAGVAVAFVLVRWSYPRRGTWRRAGNQLVRIALAAAAVWLVSPAVAAFFGWG